ncbi:NUDIX domain-containing protein [Candidatus Saccharibacteria bacterium]|nr:NUDIX domain-containing protein [Candidatus Saccharibacteria bacterium]
MAHIHTKPGQHDHTASAYIVRVDGNEPRIMLHRHKLDRVYLQFGGHVELDENPWQTLIHELREEAGYDISQLKILQPKLRLKQLTKASIHPIPICYNTHSVRNAKKHYHTDSVFALTTQESPKHSLAEGESQDLRLFTRQEISDLPDSEIFPMAREMALFIFDQVLPNWEQIPTKSI